MKIFKKCILVIIFFLSSHVGASGRLSFKDFQLSSVMEGANFAGHYYISSFICGDGVICDTIEDIKTGSKKLFPNSYIVDDINGHQYMKKFYPDSSLIIISAKLANPDKSEKGDGFAIRYYNFKGGEFILLKKILK